MWAPFSSKHATRVFFETVISRENIIKLVLYHSCILVKVGMIQYFLYFYEIKVSILWERGLVFSNGHMYQSRVGKKKIFFFPSQNFPFSSLILYNGNLLRRQKGFFWYGNCRRKWRVACPIILGSTWESAKKEEDRNHKGAFGWCNQALDVS